MPQAVKFKSGGVNCAGDLYLPSGFSASRNYPGLVVGHGTAQTKKSLVNQGEFFSRAGYVVLAIDYRSFGESDGEPRGQLFPLVQVEDFRNGVSFLQRTQGVDRERIGIWGTSNSGGTVIYAAAVDPRIKAVVAQVPVVNHFRWMRWLRSQKEWSELLENIEEDRQRRYDTGAGARIPVSTLDTFCYRPLLKSMVSKTGEAIEKTGKPPLAAGATEVVLESLEKALEFDATAVIDRIAPRALSIITTKQDDAHPIEQIVEAYEMAREPKSLTLLDMYVLDVYWEPGLSIALGKAVEWYDKFL
ncbi:MAG TPA: alpha/beta fold hydrolase [Candidatus Binataceae bacterium]|nr:alpha/beta fold hydrolase [Candidatus Binataceae bacterium]